MVSIGTHVKRLRTAKRMTHQELAERLHVTRQEVSAWEMGKALPDVDMLEHIAGALDTDVAKVIYGSKNAPALVFLKRKWRHKGVNRGFYLLLSLLSPILLRRVEQLDS